jgi:single-stranded-DNA-specific exonuclease
MPDLFTKFGGHRQAAGVTLASGRVEEFRARFRTHAATQLTAADFEAQLQIDSPIEFSEINDRSVGDVLSLAPFGFGNPSPVFMARDVEVAAAPEIKKERHVFVRLASQGRTLRVKAWNFAERVPELAAGARIDAALCFEDDPYSAGRGYAPWATVLKDIRAASSTATNLG